MAGATALAGWNGRAATGPVATNSGSVSGLAAVDGTANAAACSLSMGQLFERAIYRAGHRHPAGRRHGRQRRAVSPVVIGNPNNGEFRFAGAGGGAPTAAQATGAVARATVEEDKDIVAVLNARGGQGGTVNAIVCPSGLRSSAATCRGAIDPAGAGLALLAVAR